MPVKFHYFGVYARGEPARMILSKGGKLAWEDNRFGFDQWGAIKPTMPNQQVPCLEFEDGTKMGESKAIVRYVAMKNGFYPEVSYQAFLTDEAIETWGEVLAKTYPPQFAPDEATKAKLMDVTFATHT